MSYNKLDYKSLSLPQLTIELEDMISCRNYMEDEYFGEGENFDTECRVILDEIRNKFREYKEEHEI